MVILLIFYYFYCIVLGFLFGVDIYLVCFMIEVLNFEGEYEVVMCFIVVVFYVIVLIYKNVLFGMDVVFLFLVFVRCILGIVFCKIEVKIE